MRKPQVAETEGSSSPVSHPISESPSTQVGGDSVLLGPDRLKRWPPTGDTAAMRTDRSRGILLATTLIAFVIQNSIAWPYARKHGLRKAAADFFKFRSSSWSAIRPRHDHTPAASPVTHTAIG